MSAKELGKAYQYHIFCRLTGALGVCIFRDHMKYTGNCLGLQWQRTNHTRISNCVGGTSKGTCPHPGNAGVTIGLDVFESAQVDSAVQRSGAAEIAVYRCSPTMPPTLKPNDVHNNEDYNCSNNV